MAQASQRTILLLQGPPCKFWRELGAGLRAQGFRVIHIGFHMGDALFWRGPGQRLYRGTLEDWPDWLRFVLDSEDVSDILYYADRLPYHVEALTVARGMAVRCWAIENGYLRPDWITMEPEGMGAHSRFTRSPQQIEELSANADVPDLAPLYHHSFTREAFSEVTYHLAMALGTPIFSKYNNDKYYPPLLDYLCWLKRWSCGGAARRRAKTTAKQIGKGGPATFLLALQLQSDYQIRASSPYSCLSEMLEEVIASFATEAPQDTRLVVKLHPMDNGWENWPEFTTDLAERYGVAERVVAIDGGELKDLLLCAKGVVTVNSTVGLHALRLGCPVIVLGDAIYDVEGLTHRSGLMTFWRSPTKPNPELFACYAGALASEIQVRGSFYDPAGRATAIKEIAQRLTVAERYWRLYRGPEEVGCTPYQLPAVAAE